MHTKIFPRSVLLLVCFAVVQPWSLCAGPLAPAFPASLAVASNQEVALTLTAKGVQIYECRPTSGDPTKFEWAFKAPEADLFDVSGHKAGRHSAGPTWELADGSKVTGRVKAKADSPDGKGVPWLLLESTGNTGAGALSRIQSIQRVDTVGGKPPAEPADQTKAGQERRVDYTAKYVFYTANP